MGKLEKPVIIGIAGGSGSGKTTIAHEIADNINDQDRIMIMTQDSFYVKSSIIRSLASFFV